MEDIAFIESVLQNVSTVMMPESPSFEVLLRREQVRLARVTPSVGQYEVVAKVQRVQSPGDEVVDVRPGLDVALATPRPEEERTKPRTRCGILLELKDIALLYELWTFFRLADEITAVPGESTRSIARPGQPSLRD